MEYSNLGLKELHHLLATKALKPSTLAKEVTNKIKADKDSHSLITFPEATLLQTAEKLDQAPVGNSLVWGVPYVAKDNFASHGLRTTAGTKILKNFVPPYTSHVVEQLNHQGGLLAGKANMDELGMGGSGLSSAFGPVYHPHDSSRLIGGSSSGSAYVVAKGIVPYSLGTDTGDSIRKPASYGGIVGFKPTYGALSRYGIIPYAPSLDHPGFFTRNVEDAAILADASFGFDKRDFTSLELNEKKFLQQLDKLPKNTSFGYLRPIDINLPEDLRTKYQKLYRLLENQGFKVKALDFSQELLDVLASVYMMISFTEAVSTHANLTGIHFGARGDGTDYAEMITSTRTQNLGPVVRRRFLLGSLNLKHENQEIYMNKAKKVRRLIVEALDKVYQQVDVLLLPPAVHGAPEAKRNGHDQIENEPLAFLTNVLILGNFNGMPSITIPFTHDAITNLPIGINLNAKPAADLLTLQAAYYLEQLFKKHHF